VQYLNQRIIGTTFIHFVFNLLEHGVKSGKEVCIFLASDALVWGACWKLQVHVRFAPAGIWAIN